MQENYFNYFTEIEEYFVRLRGRNLLISPLDWCLIELWKDNQIPLHVVLRGIDRSFDSTAKRKKRPPTTLFYCHPAVMEAFEEYQEAMIGSEGEDFDAGPELNTEISKPQLISHLDRILRAVKAQEHAGFEAELCRLAALRDEVRSRAEIALPELDRELRQIAESLVEGLKKELDREELKRLKAECRSELKIYRKHVSKEVYDQLQVKHLEKKLWERLDLPDFSLLTIGG